MVNWKQVAEDDLRKYLDLKRAVSGYKDRVALLDGDMTSLQAVSFDDMPKGGEYSADDELVNLIVAKMEIEDAHKRNINRLKLIETGLAALDEQERMVLDLFYVHRCHDAADTVCRNLHVERSSAYNLRNRALWRYVAAAYGIV